MLYLGLNQGQSYLFSTSICFNFCTISVALTVFIFVLFLVFFSLATLCHAQKLLLGMHSEITPGILGKPMVCWELKPVHWNTRPMP